MPAATCGWRMSTGCMPFETAVGVEAALWSELVHADATADDRLWPRLAAVAEVGWSP
ncbi:MAG: family 20 glycosylhydrolase, partial [Burkholderiales bacterium]|nr:family 20 glycosylhydrolase [Burkholderiales bacterium]